MLGCVLTADRRSSGFPHGLVQLPPPQHCAKPRCDSEPAHCPEDSAGQGSNQAKGENRRRTRKSWHEGFAGPLPKRAVLSAARPGGHSRRPKAQIGNISGYVGRQIDAHHQGPETLR